MRIDDQGRMLGARRRDFGGFSFLVRSALDPASTAEFDYIWKIYEGVTCFVLDIEMLVVESLLFDSRGLGARVQRCFALPRKIGVLKGHLDPIPAFVEASANTSNVTCAVTGRAMNRVILKRNPSTVDGPMAAGAYDLAAHCCRGPFSDRMSLHVPSELDIALR